MPFVYKFMPQGADTAISILKKALELDPGYADAHATLAWCFQFRFNRGGRHEKDRAASIYHARAALTTGGDNATALAIAGAVILFDDRDIATAFDLFDRALALSNSNVFALSLSGTALAWRGMPELAIERARHALRISPFDSLNYLPYIALSIANFQTGALMKRETGRDAPSNQTRISAFLTPCWLQRSPSLGRRKRRGPRRCRSSRSSLLSQSADIPQWLSLRRPCFVHLPMSGVKSGCRRNEIQMARPMGFEPLTFAFGGHRSVGCEIPHIEFVRE